MSETYQASLIVEQVDTPADFYVEPSTESFISDLEGFSNEQLSAFAEEFDSQLGPLIASNADIIVSCNRLGGAEMSLSQAVNAIWPASNKGAMVKEGLPSVMAEVQQMILTARTKIDEQNAEPEEESEEKDNLEEAESDQAKDQEAKKEVGEEQKTEPENQKPAEFQESDESITQPNQPAALDRQPELSLQQINTIITPAAESVTSVTPSPIDASQTSQPTVKAESAADAVGVMQITASKKTINNPQSKPAAATHETFHGKKGNSESEPAISAEPARTEAKIKVLEYATLPDVEAMERLPILEEIVPEAAADESSQELPKPHEQLINEQAAPPPSDLHEEKAHELTAEAKLIEQPDFPNDFETEIAVDEEESLLPGLDDNSEINDYSDFIEGEVLLLDHTEDYVLIEDRPYAEIESDEKYELHMYEDDGLNKEDIDAPAGVKRGIQEPIESATPELLIPTNLAIEEVEETVVNLYEHIENSEPETTEAVNDILKKIDDVTAKIEESEEESTFVRAEAQEGLEKLFTELFEKLDMDYTSELIESLVALTIERHLDDELLSISTEGKDDDVHDVGTHEVINKLLVGINNVKKGIAHANYIGRSALRLAINKAT